MSRSHWKRTGWALAIGGCLLASRAGEARAQLPGLPAAVAKPADGKAKAGADGKADDAHAKVIPTAGPIDVEKPVDDWAIERTLNEDLPKYPGVRDVTVTVKDGVVTLLGQVDDDDTLGAITEDVRRIKGVRLILNRMNTDAEVMTAPQLALKVVGEYRDVVARKWLLAILALAILAAMALLARLFNRYAESLLAPFVKNVMLRSILGSILGSALVLGGVLMALSVLDLTRVVLSILGLAGVVGLAVGFAFRDIAENFIASVLLGVRRPFQIGDYIQVAGQAGVVRSLNTRATVLVTLEGNHVRIPNATVFKEILVNSSSSPSSRGSFDVVLPYQASTATATEAIDEALRRQEGLLPDPAPRSLIQALEPNGVRLRAFYWLPAQGVDGDKIHSDAKLKVKVALQEAGIAPAPTGVTLSVAGRVPVELAQADGHGGANGNGNGRAHAEQARDNLRRDARAAAEAAPDPDRTTPAEHVMSEPEACVTDEGANLLK